MNERERKDHLFENFIHWGFQCLLVAGISWGVSELAGMNKSVQELNVKLAVVIEKESVHDREIEKIDTRLDKIELRRR